MSSVDPIPSRGLSRRGVLTLGVGAFVVASFPLAARRPAAAVRRTVPVMGTLAEFVIVHAEPSAAQAAIDAGIEALRTTDRLMTRFSDLSDVGRANRLAAAGPVTVTPETAAVLREALAWAEASAGAFDPCLGRAIRLWDVAHRRTPPAPGAVARLAGRELYRAVELDTWQGYPAVRFADADVQLDLGGIAKGYGVDRAVDALRRHGIRQALVNVGGDLYALGESEPGAPWRVGVRSPADPGQLVDEIRLADGAVATSGDYLQYFVHDGRRYHHLLDPETGAPRATPVRSLSVMAPTCLAADAAATAAYGMASARAAGLLARRARGAQIVSMITGQA